MDKFLLYHTSLKGNIKKAINHSNPFSFKNLKKGKRAFPALGLSNS